jgi:hypothetical protein
VAEAQSPVLAKPTVGNPLRLLVVGEALAAALQTAGGVHTGTAVVAILRDPAHFEAETLRADVDMLVVDMNTLHEDSAARIVDWLARVRAVHAVVVYRYASAEALSRLPASKCSAIRAPVDGATLLAHCQMTTHGGAPESVSGAAEVAAIARVAPPRRYDDATLSELAALPSTVKCECPRHLAELICALSAFERYSAECESRSPGDAALHAFLQSTASQARHLIEDALSHVIEVENIQL